MLREWERWSFEFREQARGFSLNIRMSFQRSFFRWLRSFNTFELKNCGFSCRYLGAFSKDITYERTFFLFQLHSITSNIFEKTRKVHKRISKWMMLWFLFLFGLFRYLFGWIEYICVQESYKSQTIFRESQSLSFCTRNLFSV